ncbi:MAG: hypothetical protein UX17_C0029G0013 [Parcubacteria group bacterium GW2011_GWC2_45_7]|nr:MAG: hypothetical protein UX17_C0029G0013 [Parcubacteria group bacterium GW2011_GWC2_45_7]KKU73541.1 MAG: hypothetical protein UX98_C0006G0039 [Parcubacteria group bacterium GW2011_GWA2_47_26]
MTPETFAKILGIIEKTGDRVIVVDPKSGAPFTLMRLTEYEELLNKVSEPVRARASEPLTAAPSAGSIDPDVALWQGATKNDPAEWESEAETEEEDRYYMEPAE